jgi:hypothetical protein
MDDGSDNGDEVMLALNDGRTCFKVQGTTCLNWQGKDCAFKQVHIPYLHAILALSA